MNPRVQEERLNLVLSIARKRILALVYPYSPDRDDVASMAGEVYARWAQPGGPGDRAGFVRMVPTARGMSPEVLELDYDVDELVSTIDRAARQVTKAWKKQREKEGAFTEGMAETMAAPSALSLEAQAAKSELMDRLVGLLNRMKSGNLSNRTRAALVELHLGSALFPSQPASLLPRRRWNRKSKRWDVKLSKAYEDFLRHHALDRERTSAPCPTCRTISRFVRVEGLDGAAVSDVVDAFALRARGAS